jgi:hypothetical protein
MGYVSVEHQPGVWVDAHIEKQRKHGGRWRLSCYHFVENVRFYRVFDADQVGPVSSRQSEQRKHPHDRPGNGTSLRDDDAAALRSVTRHLPVISATLGLV